MAKREDSRIIRTKTALLQAFLAMLEEMPYEDISINDLCQRGGVRRATFYKHFKDKNDFMYFVIRILRENFDKYVWSHYSDTYTKEYYLRYAERLITFLREREAIVARILSSESMGLLIGIMIHQNIEDTKKRLEKSVEGGLTLSVSTNVLAAMLTGSVATVITRWFLLGCEQPESELISEISHIIDRMIQ